MREKSAQSSEIRAVILAAGQGLRLKPLTDFIPKCLVPVKGKPLLGRWIDECLRQRCSEVLVNVHAKAGMVEDFIADNYSDERIHLAYEKNLLGTWGTIKNLPGRFFEGDLLALHCDNYYSQSLDEFIRVAAQNSCGSVAHLCAFDNTGWLPSQIGQLSVDGQSGLIAIREKQEELVSNLGNAAIYFFKSEFFQKNKNLLYDEGCTDIACDVINKVEGPIRVFELTGHFSDIGTPEAFMSINNLLDR